MKLLNLILLTTISCSPVVLNSPNIGELPNEGQLPKLITMNYYGDASKQMAFCWNTSLPTDSDLQVVKKSIGDFSSSEVLQFKGSVEKSKVANDGFIHRIVAKNLQAGESYLYRVGDKELDYWSDVGEFTTIDKNSKSSFIHISDPQIIMESDKELYNQVLKTALSSNDPSFICLTGDIVNNSLQGMTPNLEQWEFTITNQKEIFQNIPLMSVPGNHESADYDFVSRFNLPYDENCNQKNGAYYSFDYNDIHFTCLNTNDSSNDPINALGLSELQINWLSEDLKNASSSKWKVVMMHKGIFDAGSHCQDAEGQDADIEIIRRQLSPIFSKFDVDLVLQGHDHLYSRSYPLNVKTDNENINIKKDESEKMIIQRGNITYEAYKNASGPIYLNSGSSSGSKYYDVVSYNEQTMPIEKAYGAKNPMYTAFEIEGNTLFSNVYEVIDGQAVLYDTFALCKSENNFNYTSLIIIGTAILLAGGIFATIMVIKKKGEKKHG